MNRIVYCEFEKSEDPRLFEQLLPCVSVEKRKQIMRMRPGIDRRLSLYAEIIVRRSPESLKSKDELMHWLVEHGANHLQLMDFCSDYMAKYCNELCWQYPISDGKHLGTYIVLVKEGVLSLPYPKHNHSDSKSEKGIQNE